MSMKVSRRQFLQATGGALSVGLLSACVAPGGAPAPSADGGASAPSAEPGSLWVILDIDFHDTYNQYTQTALMDYAAEQGWELEVADSQGFAAGSGETERLAAAVQAGDPPDLVRHTLSSQLLHELDLTLPVSDLVAEVEAVFGAASPYLQNTKIYDGEWWSVPYHQRAGGGYYRKDAFDAIGVDLQTVRTYDALAEVCLQASTPELFGWGITVNRSGDGNSLIQRVKCGWGAGWQDETGQFINTNTPEMIAAMNFIKDIYSNEQWKPMLPPGVEAWNDLSNNEAFHAEVIAYTENAGTVYAKALVDGLPVAEKTAYLAPPGGPVNQEFNTIGSKDWFIMKGAKNVETAKQAILAFTADLAKMDAMLESSPAYAVPAYTNLWEMSEYTKSNPMSLQVKPAALDASGIEAGSWPGPPSAALTAIENSGIWNDMVNAFLTGTPVEEAVATAHDRMVLVFQEYGLPGTK
jgi:multiple sugar transport system substrate-binding protein